jgi:hypothetical protein
MVFNENTEINPSSEYPIGVLIEKIWVKSESLKFGKSTQDSSIQKKYSNVSPFFREESAVAMSNAPIEGWVNGFFGSMNGVNGTNRNGYRSTGLEFWKTIQ